MRAMVCSAFHPRVSGRGGLELSSMETTGCCLGKLRSFSLAALGFSDGALRGKLMMSEIRW